jgi:hypothetical protein
LLAPGGKLRARFRGAGIFDLLEDGECLFGVLELIWCWYNADLMCVAMQFKLRRRRWLISARGWSLRQPWVTECHKLIEP